MLSDSAEITRAINEVLIEKNGTLEVRPEIERKIDKFLESLQLPATVGFVGGAGTLAWQHHPELHVGGAALTILGLIIADLQATGGKIIAKKAADLFGSLDNALEVFGLVGCTTLGGAAFAHMVQEHQVTNPSDPRWLIVAANIPVYLSANLLNDVRLRNAIDQRFGETLELSYREDNETKSVEVPRSKFFQKLAFALGGAFVTAFGHAINDPTTTAIGVSFVTAPTVDAINTVGASKIPKIIAHKLKEGTANSWGTMVGNYAYGYGEPVDNIPDVSREIRDHFLETLGVRNSNRGQAL